MTKPQVKQMEIKSKPSFSIDALLAFDESRTTLPAPSPSTLTRPPTTTITRNSQTMQLSKCKKNIRQTENVKYQADYDKYEKFENYQTHQFATTPQSKMAVQINAKSCESFQSKNRSPRIPFSREQIRILETKYQEMNYLSGWEVLKLAKKLNLTETRVKIWFQNRRARARRDQIDESAPTLLAICPTTFVANIDHNFVQKPANSFAVDSNMRTSISNIVCSFYPNLNNHTIEHYSTQSYSNFAHLNVHSTNYCNSSSINFLNPVNNHVDSASI